MKKCLLAFLVVKMCLISVSSFSQKDKDAKDTSTMLGMAGDNLDLYAVLTLFQKSKTIEAFEKSLNEEKTGINNLDLNLDKKVDFIKVVTKQVDSSYTFTLQVDVTKKETQDVATILLDKIKGRISLQIVGDEDLYGKDYVIEPKGNSPVTANPAYVGPDPVVVNVPASTTVVVQSAPIVQYVYSPVYVPYTPPYYYGYYPPYFAAFTIMAVGIYRSNHYYGYGGYYGGHYSNNTVIINNGNRNQINHNTVRNSSRTVSDNASRGNYGDNRGRDGARNSASTRPSTSDRSRGGGLGHSAPTRPSTSDRSRGGGVSSSRPSASHNFSSRGPAGGGRSMGGGRPMGGGGRRR